MRQVEFQANGVNIKSYDDLGLLLTDVTIDPPEPKRVLIDVPGRDGELDLTSSVGGVSYKNRKITLTFHVADYRNLWDDVFSDVIGAIHGKKFKVYIRPVYWYWDAFCEIKSMKSNKNLGTIVLELDAFPYQKIPHILSFHVNTGNLLAKTIDIGELRQVPNIRVTEDAEVTQQITGTTTSLGTYELQAGYNTPYDLVLTPAACKLLFKGGGDIQIEYDEGKL